jgi:hypothetical protein
MKLSIQNIILLILVFIFIAGFIVLLNNGLQTHSHLIPNKCPKLLVRNGIRLSLLDSVKNEISSFNSLEEYKKYLEVQKKNGIHCPVMYIQEENNTQGDSIYKMYSNPFELDPGFLTMYLSNSMENMETTKTINVLDADRQNTPYNANQYPGFDPNGQNVGQYTNIDVVHDSTKKSNENDNAMDTNWHGVSKTHESVATGKYYENEIHNYNPFDNNNI